MIVSTRLGVLYSMEYIEKIKELTYIYTQRNLSILVAFRPKFNGQVAALDRWISV